MRSARSSATTIHLPKFAIAELVEPPAHVDGEDPSIIGARGTDPVSDAASDFAEGGRHLQERKLGKVLAFRAYLDLPRGAALGGGDCFVIGSHNKKAPPRRDDSRRTEEFREQRLLLAREERQVALAGSGLTDRGASRTILRRWHMMRRCTDELWCDAAETAIEPRTFYQPREATI